MAIAGIASMVDFVLALIWTYPIAALATLTAAEGGSHRIPDCCSYLGFFSLVSVSSSPWTLGIRPQNDPSSLSGIDQTSRTTDAGESYLTWVSRNLAALLIESISFSLRTNPWPSFS